VDHSVRQLVAQRIYGLALGYEDLNDHDWLRLDPLLATACDKRDPLDVSYIDGRCRVQSDNGIWVLGMFRRLIVAAHRLMPALRTAFLRPQGGRLLHPDQHPLFFFLVIHARYPPGFAQRQYLLKYFFGNHSPFHPLFPLHSTLLPITNVEDPFFTFMINRRFTQFLQWLLSH